MTETIFEYYQRLHIDVKRIEGIMTETLLEYYNREATMAARELDWVITRSREERFLPHPNTVYCSQCGRKFVRYLRAVGYSHCEDHPKE